MIKRGGLPPRRRLTLALMAILALLSCDLFDIIPPKIEIVSPKADDAYFASLPVELKATDNRKVIKVEVFLEGESVHEFTKSPYQTTLSLAGVSNPASLKAVAHDKAGNYAEASREVSLSLGFKLSSPNGGETWAEQSNQTITWESSGNVGSTVSLHYSTDGGNTWDEIIGSTTNNGTYTWTLPNFTETATDCRIKVSKSQYDDISDSTFTITAEPNTITLTAPNGGEVWAEQSTQTITWTSSGDVGDFVGLDYSLNRDATWIEIVASTANNGSYSWMLPNLNDTHTSCCVMVTSNSTSHFSQSDANFTISAEPNYITIISPNGDETWAEQSTQTITWDYSGDVGDYVSLHYLLDEGTTWSEITASTPIGGSHDWTLPNLAETSTACRVKVASTSTSFADTSDNDFTITGGEIMVTSPNGGESWREWSAQTITWTSSSDVGSYVSLHYSLDAGTNWTEIADSTLNVDSYSWTLPAIGATETACRVKVASTSIQAFDISDGDFTITNWVPALAGSHDTPGGALDVFVSGSYAYVADGSSGLQIIDVSNPAGPTLAGSYNTPGDALGVSVSGGYAYVADNASGLQVINVSNPASPTLAGAYDTPEIAGNVFVSGGYAYVANEWSGLQIVDVSNPASPALVGTYDTPGNVIGVFVSGSYAYVADGGSAEGSGLQVIDVSNPASPTLVGTYDMPFGGDVFVSGGYAYMADWGGDLQIYNVSNPASPTPAGFCDTPGYASGVFVSGSYAYVADHEGGLQVINVSNPASPTLAGSCDTPGYALGIFVSGSYAYVADEESGMLIFDVSGLP